LESHRVLASGSVRRPDGDCVRQDDEPHLLRLRWTSVVVDATTGKVVASIKNGGRVDALGWDPAKKLIYIPNGQKATSPWRIRIRPTSTRSSRRCRRLPAPRPSAWTEHAQRVSVPARARSGSGARSRCAAADRTRTRSGPDRRWLVHCIRPRTAPGKHWTKVPRRP
jgi:hypothetical protein